MKEPLVSVLMPVKNGSLFLDECLQSILHQTISDWELIVVDDHSSDNTVQILSGYAAKDDRIKVVSNKGVGIASAIELAFMHSSGRYITRMDADDVMAPSKLQLMSMLLAENEHTVIVSLVKYFSEDSIGEGYRKYEEWLNGLAMRNEQYRWIYKECVIPSPSWMASRKELEAYNMLVSLAHPEDYDLCFRFYEQKFEVSVVPEKLHFWRDHPYRTSRVDTTYDIRKFGLFKLKWFLKLELKEEDKLVIWGCGAKGKEMARYLVEQHRPFHWVTGSMDRIGQCIYDVEIESPEILSSFDQPKIIVAVGAPTDQRDIVDELLNKGFLSGKDFFLFC